LTSGERNERQTTLNNEKTRASEIGLKGSKESLQVRAFGQGHQYNLIERKKRQIKNSFFISPLRSVLS
jgi:hypothetical protein